jgi:hypothetical protein
VVSQIQVRVKVLGNPSVDRFASFTCPTCQIFGTIDRDQFQGKTSVKCGCGFHGLMIAPDLMEVMGQGVRPKKKFKRMQRCTCGKCGDLINGPDKPALDVRRISPYTLRKVQPVNYERLVN